MKKVNVIINIANLVINGKKIKVMALENKKLKKEMITITNLVINGKEIKVMVLENKKIKKEISDKK